MKYKKALIAMSMLCAHLAFGQTPSNDPRVLREILPDVNVEIQKINNLKKYNRDLNSVLDGVCSNTLISTSIENHNQVCHSIKPLFGQKVLTNIIKLDLLYSGYFNGIPVFINDDTEPNAVTLSLNEHDSKKSNAILISTGFLDAIRKIPNSKEVLTFVLHHEIGHIKLGHNYKDDIDILRKNEIEADNYAYAKMSFANPESAHKAASGMISLIKNIDVDPSIKEIVLKLAKSREDNINGKNINSIGYGI